MKDQSGEKDGNKKKKQKAQLSKRKSKSKKQTSQRKKMISKQMFLEKITKNL